MVNRIECGRKQLWYSFKVLSGHLPGGIVENDKKNLYKHDQFPRRELNLGPHKYGVVTTMSQQLVKRICSYFWTRIFNKLL
jgi:hypothetical protein